LLPIHNGTFDLSMHAWYEPFDRILALAWERNVSITTPQMGEAFNVKYPQRGRTWWLDLENEMKEEGRMACSGYKSG
jgi:hypothetical protein